MEYKIVLDPGHGGRDIGAEGPCANEADVTLVLAHKLAQELNQLGHKTKLTRTTDVYMGLTRRADIANNWNADLFVSLHCNAAASTTAEGIEVFCFPDSVEGNLYAKAIQDGLTEAFPDHKDRGVKEANFAVLRKTNMAAVLVEAEFISNANQCKFLTNEANQDKIASTIAKAISGRLE